jgi:hypothetical protein
MKINSAALVMILALATPAMTALAQDNEPGEDREPRELRREHFVRPDRDDLGGPREERPEGLRPPGRGERLEGERRERGEGFEGERSRGPRRVMGPDAPGRPRPARVFMPVIATLDIDHDGVIDEKEIKGAAKALKKLDENGDGKLAGEELHPRPPQPPQPPQPPRRVRGFEGEERPGHIHIERFHHRDAGPQGPPRGEGSRPGRPLPPPEDER